MKILLGEERVVVRGMTFEENPWGKYQFPKPYNANGRLFVSVHVEDDTIVTTGNPTLWFESVDKGETWVEVSAETATEACGLKLPNGDKIYFPIDGGIDLSEYKFPSFNALTPDYDFKKPAQGKEMPIQDGLMAWRGSTIRAYNADRLPFPLNQKKWRLERVSGKTNEKTVEYVDVDWPYLTRVVFTVNGKSEMKPIHPVRAPKIGPDGAIWINTFSGEAHLNPENGQFCPYYSAEIFRSTDNGKTFYRHSHMGYPADGNEYPYLSGGFSDNDYEFMDDGSMIWFFRSTWFCSTGYEWAPMYMSRSFDKGLTWTKPEKFSEMGVYPSLCKLDCGVTLICYARPGLFVQMCENSNPYKWSEPLVVLDAKDRSHLANVEVENPTFHQWDGQCGNPQLLRISENEALLFYGDFYYPDEEGTKRKTILCRRITVVND